MQQCARIKTFSAPCSTKPEIIHTFGYCASFYAKTNFTVTVASYQYDEWLKEAQQEKLEGTKDCYGFGLQISRVKRLPICHRPVKDMNDFGLNCRKNTVCS